MAILIAVLTSAVGDASKLCLVVLFTVSGRVPCSGAQRQSKGLDEVSTAILGDAVAENAQLNCVASWRAFWNKKRDSLRSQIAAAC